MARRTLILRQRLALGDAVLLTALVRDIQRTYSGYFQIRVDSHYREVWDHNPHARLFRSDEDLGGLPLTQVSVSYTNGIRAAGSGSPLHMLAWYHRDFAAKSGMALEPLEPCGDLHLSEEESRPLIGGPYWLLLAGGKLDATVKIWWAERWQAVVDQLNASGLRVVQAGAKAADHRHPRLSGVLDAVGQFPSARQFFNLVKNAQGVLCPITAATHIAACFNKPCVVVAGGREEVSWEHYANVPGRFGSRCRPLAVEHRFLSTIGQLPCCSRKGCWKHRTVALNRRDAWDAPDKRCHQPVLKGEASCPACLDLIRPELVVAAVESYYAAGILRRDGSAPPPTVLPPPLAPEPIKVVLSPPEPPPAPPPVHSARPRRPELIEHPLLGGKLTCFFLCYGDYPQIAQAGLESILDSVPTECLDLRVGLNAVSSATAQLVAKLPVSAIYDSPDITRKYPRMRQMFRDPACPVPSPYLVWFDDDAKAVDGNWASQLCRTIVSQHPRGSRLFGAIYLHDLAASRRPGHDPLAWFRTATWWRKRHLLVRGSNAEAPNGSVIRFATGWCWALARELIELADIPDHRLQNNGGDVVIGEQVHQTGYTLASWNEHKKLIFTPPKENGGRRGPTTRFPWWPPS